MADMVNDDTLETTHPPSMATTAIRIKTKQGFRLYRFTPARRAAVAAALRYLSGQCDGAVKRDDVGFNRQDTASSFVKSLVTLAWSGETKGYELTDAQAAWGLTCLWKYRTTQLEAHADALWPEGMDEVG